MLTWIAQNTVVAFGLASLALTMTLLLPKRPAIGHVLWVCVLVALIAPPLPRHGLLDGRSHALRAANRAASTWQSLSATPGITTPPAMYQHETERLERELTKESGAEREEWPSSWQTESERTSPPAESRETPERNTRSEVGLSYASGEQGIDDEPAADRAADTASIFGDEETAYPAPALAAAPALPPLPDLDALTAGEKRSKLRFVGTDWARLLGTAAVVIWILGACLMTTRHVREIIGVARLVRRGARVTPAFRGFVERVAMDLGVGSPRVRTSDEIATPFVWGALRPTLMWPAGETETSPGARAVLAHELAHLERRDHWTAWLETIATCVLWWHPLVYAARRELRRQAEKACDAWVVWAYPTDRRHYADALLDAVERLGLTPKPATALGAVDTDKRSLTRRLLMIMNDNVARRGSRVLALAAAGLTAVLAPTWAAASGPAAEVVMNAGSDIDRSLRPMLEKARLQWEANVYANGDDHEGALAAMNALVKVDPENAGLHSDLAMMLYKQGEYRAAAKHFAEAGDLDKQDADQVYNAACCLALAGDERAAMRTLRTAVALGYADGGHAEQDSDLESLHGSTEFKDLAASIGDLESLWESADEAMEDEHWTEAASAFKSASGLAPECAELQHYLGYCSIMSGDVGTAKAAFERAKELGFSASICEYNLACVSTALGRYDEAFEHLFEAVELGFGQHKLMREDPDLEPLRGDSRYKEALRMVTAPERLRRELEMAMEFGEYEAAVEKARELADASEHMTWQHSWVYHQLGMALFMAEDYRGAENAFIDAAEAGYPLEDALYNVACTKAKRGDTDGALEYLSAAVEAGYDDADHMRADTDLEALHGDRAFVTLTNHAADRQILEGFAAPNWGYLLERSRDQIDADDTNGLAHLQLGWALLRTDRTAQAREVFERQGEIGFMPGIAHYNVACCDAIMGRKAAALASLEQALEYGAVDVDFMREDPDLANLHGDAQFESMLEAHDDDKHDHDGDGWDDDDEDEDDDWDDDDEDEDEDDWDDDEI